MKAELWYFLLGLLLIAVTLVSRLVKRLPLTLTIFYLLAGALFGVTLVSPGTLEPYKNASLLERLAEVAVIVSLFSTGLKLSSPLKDRQWSVVFRLAFLSMAITVGLITVIGVFLLGLPVGAGVLLGAVLAPTDPVLASEVQVASPDDTDKLRFSLTGEAGLNDGTAFPFVMLGLGLLGLHELGEWGWRWFTVDLAWAVAGGLAIGAASGIGVGRIVVHLRAKHQEGIGHDEFLAVGLIGLSYGAALLLEAYGFLSVFAAGLALRRMERHHSQSLPDPEVRELAHVPAREEAATDPRYAPAYMAQAVLGSTERAERMLEVGLVLIVGVMLVGADLNLQLLWFAPLLYFVVRPVAVWLGCMGAKSLRAERGFIAWFGIRGIGSIYYLMFAITHGLPEHLARPLIELTLGVIAISVVLHGISVTPLMNMYERRRGSRSRGGKPAPGSAN